MSLKKLGSWPDEGPKLRVSPGKLIKTGKDDLLQIIWGKEHPVLMKFLTSNDYVHVTKVIIPTGGREPRYSEIIEHRGDTVLFVLKGTVFVLLNDSSEVLEAEEEDAVFIPENTKQQYINYGDEIVELLKVVSPHW